MRTGHAMNDRRIGRAGFLGVLAAGLAGIFFANDALDAVEEALPRGIRSQLPWLPRQRSAAFGRLLYATPTQ